MEGTDSSTSSQPPPQPQLPPGFRFHPTDEELVVHYLKKKATSSPLPVAIIAEVDLYKFDPWELPAKATFGEQEWYFFSPRDRKYPNGARPNRAATSGYWKATGTDKPVLTSGGTQKVGVKKALVFYGGKPPKGIKTNWIMHEYRLAENKANNKPPGCDFGNKKNSLRLDDWVLCRIYKKNNNGQRSIEQEKDESMDEMLAAIQPSITVLGQQNSTNPRLFHLTKAAANYGTLPLLENEHNLFEGMISNNNNTNEGITTTASSISQLASPNAFSMKRTLPSLYWNDEEEGSDQSPNKRVHVHASSSDGILRADQSGNNNNSIASLLSQLPVQTGPSSLHQQQQQQPILGSLGDGLFRQQPYQLAGLNWYS